jgi:hypothetical protein
MLLVLIPVAWFVLLVIGVAACRLASSSDAAESKAEREWAFASWRMWETSNDESTAAESPADDRRRRGYGAVG